MVSFWRFPAKAACACINRAGREIGVQDKWVFPLSFAFARPVAALLGSDTSVPVSFAPCNAAVKAEHQLPYPNAQRQSAQLSPL